MTMTEESSEFCLALFMTYGYSIADWAEQGVVSREAVLYNELAEEYNKIFIFTYGRDDRRQYASEFADDIEIVDQRIISNNLLYSLCLPVLHWRRLRQVNVVKTNQMMGSWVAVVSKFLYGIPLLIRTGYILSNFARKKNVALWKRVVIYLLEFVAYKTADGIITSSPHGKRDIEARYHPKGTHKMIPNYTETSIFKPLDISTTPGSICFVGRLVEQKNLKALVQALGDLPYSLTVIGDGPLKDELAECAAVYDADVTFEGKIPNHELPEVINRHKVFCLPSHYEGMPKSLLEAMACEVAVVATDVPGTRDVLDNGVTGLLCEPTTVSLRSALTQLMNDAELQARLSKQARQTIVQEYSLERVVNQERALIDEIT